jgi:hypothetical protein
MNTHTETHDHNYCEHGTYVGGCGIDYMCGYCEEGITLAELREIDHAYAVRRAWEKIAMVDDVLACLDPRTLPVGVGMSKLEEAMGNWSTA